MEQNDTERANPFGSPVVSPTTDEFLLPREALDKRRCRSSNSRFTSPHGHRPRTLQETSHRLDVLQQAHAPQRHLRVRCRTVPRHAQDHPRVATSHARLGIRLPYRIVLRNSAWVDESYISDADLSKGHGRPRMHNISRQKLCICVMTNANKNPIAVVCGH